MSGKVRTGCITVLQEFDRNERAAILEYSHQGRKVDELRGRRTWSRPARQVSVAVAACWKEVVQVDD